MKALRLLLLPFFLIFPALADERPNFIFFLTDDISATDIGPYGNTWIKTPNLNRMAEQGLVFDRAYLTASSCSVSRNSIITGRYPHNTGAPELHMPLPEGQVTFIQQLRDAGYHTVISGKNHMGEPSQLGFQVASRGPSSSGSADWVELLANRPKDQPFFAWFASHDAHHGWDKEPGLRTYDPDDVQVPPYMADGPLTRRDMASHASEVSRTDDFVGKLMAELERQGIAGNTYLVYAADNGRPFPRCKTRMYDSGVQTPLLIWNPGKIRPARTTALASAIDLAPTFLELAGVKPAPSIQGVSLVPVLKDVKASVRDYAFSERNWHVYSAHERAIRHGDWLYIRNNFPEKPALSAESKMPSYPAAREYWEFFEAGKLLPWQLDLTIAPRPQTELYHTKSDPHQLLNLSGNPAFATIETKLAGVLAQWSRETADSIPRNPTPDRKKGDPQAGARGEIPGASTHATAINHPGPVRDK